MTKVNKKYQNIKPTILVLHNLNHYDVTLSTLVEISRKKLISVVTLTYRIQHFKALYIKQINLIKV